MRNHFVARTRNSLVTRRLESYTSQRSVLSPPAVCLSWRQQGNQCDHVTVINGHESIAKLSPFSFFMHIPVALKDRYIDCVKPEAVLLQDNVYLAFLADSRWG
jgi:hypothetical protein